MQSMSQPEFPNISLIVRYSMVPYPISDSIWLADGSLLVGAGHQMFLYGQRQLQNPTLSGEAPSNSLFEYAARHNGPLEDYHPQMLLQCLLWGVWHFGIFSQCTESIAEKVETVKQIIVNLARDIQETRAGDKLESDWRPIPVEHFLRKDGTITSVRGVHTI